MIEIIPNWHPLFVHFTVALLSLSVISFIVQRPFAETEFGDNLMVFARYSLWLGVLFSLATLAAGWDAYNTVDHDTPSHTAMTDHRNWGFGTFAIFLVAAIWWTIVKAYSEKASIAFLLCLMVGGGLLVTTGHKGSQLVYFFGLGVQNLPAKDDHKSGGAHGHSHSHDADEGKAHQDNIEGNGHHGEGEGHDDQHSHDTLDSLDENHNDVHGEQNTHDDLSSSAHEPINVVLLEAEKRMTPTIPKIEKYEDGTIRQTLPEVAMDIQE